MIFHQLQLELRQLLLCLQHLISETKVLSYKVGTLLLVLLDLFDEVFDHGLLRRKLFLESLIGVHRFLTFVDDRDVNIFDVGELVYDTFKVGVLTLKLYTLLNHIRQFRIFLPLHFVQVCGLDATRELLMLELFEEDVCFLVVATIRRSLFGYVHLIVI